MTRKEKINDPHQIRRVGIVFSGGPAPAANAVISAAAVSFLEEGREVVGFFHGYSHLTDYHPVARRLLPDVHYRIFDSHDVRGLRNQRGITIGTARANPGKGIHCPADLEDPKKTRQLHNVYAALVDLEIDALISIGGDDTLKTANFLYEYQKHLPPEAARVKVVHLPKTIDNDYRGIDFTFGFFTAVDFMAKEVLNLRADARATSSYFVIETMGRKAGWLPYGVGIAGEANMIMAVEDLEPSLMTHEERKGPDGKKVSVPCLDPLKLADRFVDLIVTREERDRKHHGTIVVAEGLAEAMPRSFLNDVARDEHGHLSLGNINLSQILSALVMRRYEARTGRKKKVRGVQLGYEGRCASPHAFDVMLGSQLGCGAYRALVEQKLDGHMVSVAGQLSLTYVPFGELINPETLVTEVRFIEPGSDFHQLARFLETRTGEPHSWNLGRRIEPS